MCCRLQLDLRELLKRGNGLFGSAEGKTAHGLLRCGDRFTPLAVLDTTSAGLTTAQVIANLNVDLLYQFLDPRIPTTGRASRTRL
jgi:hypothetical protein